jgi:hypothetical protein
MMMGLSYILTAMSLLIVLKLAASSGHEEPSPDVQVFRYQSGYINFLRWGVFVPSVMAAFVYLVTKHRPADFGLGMCMFGTVGSALVYVAYSYFRSYRIELRKSYLCVIAAGRHRVVRYADLVQVELVEGAKGFRSLIFRPKDPRAKSLELSEAVSDFDLLVSRLGENLKVDNVPIRNRDKWGTWS